MAAGDALLNGTLQGRPLRSQPSALAKANYNTDWPDNFGKTAEDRRETAKKRGVQFE